MASNAAGRSYEWKEKKTTWNQIKYGTKHVM